LSMEDFCALVNKKAGGQRYMIVDPCSGRNWFMIWVYCYEPQKWIVYREWPSFGHEKAYIPQVGDPGPWAVTSQASDGAPGSAQKTFGFGLERYREEIERLEGQEQISERWIDSRYATASTLARDSTTTLIEQLDQVGLYFRASVAESRIFGVADGSIDMINSALFYDVETPKGKFSAKLGRLNEPQLLVVETCKNVIYSLSHWSGKDGQKGASKDPIDCLRMMFLSRVEYVPEDAYKWKGGIRAA